MPWGGSKLGHLSLNLSFTLNLTFTLIGTWYCPLNLISTRRTVGAGYSYGWSWTPVGSTLQTGGTHLPKAYRSELELRMEVLPVLEVLPVAGARLRALHVLASRFEAWGWSWHWS